MLLKHTLLIKFQTAYFVNYFFKLLWSCKKLNLNLTYNNESEHVYNKSYIDYVEISLRYQIRLPTMVTPIYMLVQHRFNVISSFTSTHGVLFFHPQ